MLVIINLMMKAALVAKTRAAFLATHHRMMLFIPDIW